MSKFNAMINKACFGLKKHSPEILIVGGVVGVISAAVMACIASTKLNGVVEESNKRINDVKADENSTKKELVKAYAKTGVELFKLYSPSIAVGAVSIVCILSSNDILRKRNAALAAAAATINESFKEYRNRVIDRFGESIDKELKNNVKYETVEKTVKDENGNEKVVKETVEVTKYDGYSKFAKFFDESCPDWTKDADSNLIFLKNQERIANNLLVDNGYLYLNDVYRLIGIRETQAGHEVGWIYEDNNSVGDNYVDFGMTNVHREATRDFVNGYERVILLDFNVDGPITDRIKWHR
jgi:hypothetical protein